MSEQTYAFPLRTEENRLLTNTYEHDTTNDTHVHPRAGEQGEADFA